MEYSELAGKAVEVELRTGRRCRSKNIIAQRLPPPE